MRSRSNLRHRPTAIFAAAIFAVLFGAAPSRAQDQAQAPPPEGPAAALSSLLSAACKADQSEFASYLTTDNATAFRALPETQRTQLMKRFSLSDSAGRPLLSSDEKNNIVLRCETEDITIEFRFGAPRIRENLAFIPVDVVDAQSAQFGLVREGGNWKLLSLGLVLIDISQLSVQWAEQDLESREAAAAETLRVIADAVETYRRAFGKLPDTLAQLGPAPKDQVSPDQASLVDAQIAAGEKGGYRFRYRNASAADADTPSFELTATPAEYGKSGRKSFFLDTAGKIHAADKRGAMAGASDAVISDEKAR
jgi:type II secretory pathway pseudopilin PulG